MARFVLNKSYGFRLIASDIQDNEVILNAIWPSPFENLNWESVMLQTVRIMMASLAVLIATMGQVHAGIITTLFASNNLGNVGGVNYFDLTVLNPLGITIEKIFVNTTSTSSINLDIYTRPGTASGFQGTTTGWTLASSGSGTGLGINNQSMIDITDFFLAPGLTGIALDAVDFAFRYTNGTGSNQNYSNADLTLDFGSATNGSLGVGGVVFSPRVANITIEYSNGVPEPATLALLGIGLSGLGLARRRKQQAV